MRALLFALLLAARLRAAACFGYESIYARIIEEQVLVKFTEHVTMAGTMMTAFSTGWLYNGTVVLDDVRALVYTQALAASDDVYFVWTGHPSGAFVGYYNKGFLAAANGSRALGWVGDENFTCPAYGVDGICRAYYAIDAARGTPLDQFDGIGYDPRLRAWYYEMADAYDGATATSAWSGIYRDATLSATQHFPEDLNTSVPSNDHAMGLCSSLLGLDGAFLGVGCTAILLGSLDDAFRLAFADVDPASVLAYIREASSGYVVVASVPNATQLHAPSTTLNSASEVLFYEALSHPNDLIRTSAAHLEATGSWNRTGGPFDHAGLYYDVAAITDNGLDWNLVTLQRQSCPEGYYTSLAPGDYGSCQACQAPTTTADNNNDTYCPLCAVGYYRDGGGCAACPATGFVCDAVTVTLETLPLDAGYMRLHDESTEALACLGGKTACPAEAGRVGCDGGHFEAFSPYCSVCEPGYYLDATRCAACGRGLGVRAGVGFALAAVVVLLVAPRYLATAGSSRAQSAKLVRRERLYNKLKSKWRIVFVSFQIVYSLPNLLNGVRFPRLMRVQFEALHVLTLDVSAIFPLGCMRGGGFYGGLLFITICPVAFVGLIWALMSLRALRPSDAATWQDVKVATATATVVVTYFVLPSVTLKILQIFDCEVLDDAGGKQAFLFADYSVRCGGFDYFVYTIYAILAVFVWPVGVPLLYFTLLHRHKHEINPSVVVAAPSDAGSARARSVHAVYGRASASAEALASEERLARQLEIRSANGNIRHLGLLYTPYEPHMWWWEIAEIARRLLSTSFLLVVSRGAVGRLFFGIMISLASTKLLAVFEPYISDSDDNLAEMLQWLVTVNLLASLGIVVGHGSAALAVASMSLQVVALGAAFVLIKNDITRERKVFEEAMEELRKDIDEYKSALEATAGDYTSTLASSLRGAALLREAPRAPPTDEADAAAVEAPPPPAPREPYLHVDMDECAADTEWTGGDPADVIGATPADGGHVDGGGCGCVGGGVY